MGVESMGATIGIRGRYRRSAMIRTSRAWLVAFAVVLGCGLAFAGCADGAQVSGLTSRCDGVNPCGDPMCANLPACQSMCGNGRVEPGEECDDGNTSNGDGCDANCTLPRCGNGIVDDGEACDDGNPTNGDHCEADCTLPRCGNGIVDDGEQCDDGNAIDGDGCETSCTLPRCGNAIVDPGEECDDGNSTNGDGCDANCTIPRCGNGIADPGEACDDGNAADGDGCESDCTLPRCGNAIVDRGEECDDGNLSNGDGCDANCTRPRCGNGIVDDGEQCDDGNAIDGDTCESSCTLPRCGNGIRDRGEQCDDSNAIEGDGCTSTCQLSHTTYVKASNTGVNDQFGVSVALSLDGSTLAVGAPGEASAATGIGGNQADNTARDAGAVYVYVHTGGTWVLQAYIKASNTGGGDQFGWSVALSADGSVLAVGAPSEDSRATGTGGDPSDNGARDAGAVYVFTRQADVWHQQAYVKASNTDVDDQFGWSVALSADGATLAASALGEASAATGIDGDQVDDSIAGAGAVYVFTRDDTGWHQQAYVKSSNNDPGDGFGDGFGFAIALSADGTTLAVGAPQEDSAASGVGAEQSDNSASSSGAVYVLARDGAVWRQQAYVKASNPEFADNFGTSVALSGDGATLAVGALGEDSAATGIDGSQSNNDIAESGAAYVFARRDAAWSQQAYVKASNTGGGDQFGWSVALSPDGATLAVGAYAEDSAATGLGGDQANNSAGVSGAVYRYTRDGTAWHQRLYVKASNTGLGDSFGYSVALAADGTLVMGATGEASAATGVGGNQANNSARQAGAVYVLQ